ncbi:MAG: hypothetical protein IAC13_03490 [Firmicutes bacterium]|uniref:Uncharacterized protein n=1 Tax=Candidatus Scybalomonas excrementavium TaxID=2840943 RepID=A0A9D9N7C2_9FIRM|nr:hypothetical protein [Candidatus Scybalomonas excrementavium]
MKIYASFQMIRLDPITKEEEVLYEEFIKRMEPYRKREIEYMIFYQIEITKPEYKYAHEIAKKYEMTDQEFEEWMENTEVGTYIPGISVYESELIRVKYEKKDYERAVSYKINFLQGGYFYVEDERTDYIKPCCKQASWEFDTCLYQGQELILTSEVEKKSYARLPIGYGVSEEVKKLLLEYGADEEDFTEIKNKQGKVVFYQLTPKNVITGFSSDNDISVEDECSHCGQKRYGDKEKTKPYYMSESTLRQLTMLNRTEEMSGLELEPWYIVNKETYLLLKKHYKRMQFEPIFLKEN